MLLFNFVDAIKHYDQNQLRKGFGCFSYIGHNISFREVRKAKQEAEIETI